MGVVVAGWVLHAGAVAAALVACALFLVTVRRGASAGRGLRAANSAVFASAASTAGAVATIEVALIARDTDVGFVQNVTEEAMPVYYRITALWSAMEGSLLFWIFVLTIAAAIFVRFTKRMPPVAGLMSAAAVAGFGVVSLFASPFFLTGEGPTAKPSPLLQDHPAMGIHPPLLYAGFAALLIPYALGAAILVGGRLDARAAALLHRWTLVGWVLLGAGIGLGAWWSYAVLGWGGYWAWDPVENVSLLPWLAATVILHTVGPRTRGPRWERWTVILAGIPFVLVLAATFLTRSGLVASIHAFSLSPIGIGLSVILLVGAGAWIALCSARARVLPGGGGVRTRRGLWTAVTAGRVALLLITAVVMVGTIAPTIIAAATGDQISLGPPWYTRTLGPLALAVLLLMAIGPVLRDRNPLSGATVIGALAAAGAAVIAVTSSGEAGMTVAVTVATFILASSLARIVGRRVSVATVGALLAHTGVALTAVVIVAGAGTSVVERSLRIGEAADFGPVDAVLVSSERTDGGRYIAAEAQIVVSDGARSRQFHPELRYYAEHAAVLASPDIASEVDRDVYVSLLDVDADAGEALVRISVIPLVPWLWWTGTLVLLGGVVSLLTRASRARRPAVSSRSLPVKAKAS